MQVLGETVQVYYGYCMLHAPEVGKRRCEYKWRVREISHDEMEQKGMVFSSRANYILIEYQGEHGTETIVRQFNEIQFCHC